jgi:hypothetical protein
MPSTLPFSNKCDISFSVINAYTVSISNHSALRVYSDARPHNWKLAELQKGLILVYHGKERVGEGTGFGIPVIMGADETYFSGTSKVYLFHRRDRWVIRKEFVLDRITRSKFRNVTLENRTARAIFAYSAGLYQRHTHLRSLALKELTRTLHVDTAFVKAPPLGKVIVTFVIRGRHILVRADFRHLERERVRRIFMMNEQGSTFFRNYFNSQEKKLTDGKIGAWDGIDAEWAGLVASQSGFGFRLWRKENCILRRGREFLKDYLDWVGLDYEVSPDRDTFDYVIEILGI